MEDWIPGYIDTWNRHDTQAIVDAYTADVVYTDYGLGEVHHGRDDLKEFLDKMATNFSSDYRLELLGSVTDEVQYAYEWIMRGTHDRGGENLPASGKPYEVHGVSMGTLLEGKIREHRDYWNMLELLGQIGQAPSPATAPPSATPASEEVAPTSQGTPA